MLILCPRLVHLVLHFTLRLRKVIIFVILVHVFFNSILLTVILNSIFFSDNWQELIHRIKSKGMHPGVALKPGTPVEEVFSLVCDLFRLLQIHLTSKISTIKWYILCQLNWHYEGILVS